MTEKEWIIESFMDALKASLYPGGNGGKEGILKYCYINDMIPKCHPDTPTDEELLDLVLETAVPNKPTIRVNNITNVTPMDETQEQQIIRQEEGQRGIDELRHMKRLEEFNLNLS